MADKFVENSEEDNSVTMLDVLQEESQLEEDAYAVLGASDDRNCTYNKGYIRQALYACKTCSSQKNIRAGVCLACSFHCHEGHELVELYTKRNFRCDCGNSKFGNKECNLEKSKSTMNIENMYNQNFDGVYCTCARPYPDPENENNDEMLQCIICEDWYHSKHLGSKDVPGGDSYEEVICADCMKKHDFLWRYATKYSTMQNSTISSEKGEEILNVENLPNGCTMPQKSLSGVTGSCFWLEGWRTSLCSCESCKKIYKEQDILYLLDPKDSVQAYEEAGKITKRESQYEKGMKALASLDHVQQLTAIEEYNNLKERLKEYLQKFAENKKVVREEDIKEFFSEMESKKRPKVVVPTYCLLQIDFEHMKPLLLCNSKGGGCLQIASILCILLSIIKPFTSGIFNLEHPTGSVFPDVSSTTFGKISSRCIRNNYEWVLKLSKFQRTKKIERVSNEGGTTTMIVLRLSSTGYFYSARKTAKRVI